MALLARKQKPGSKIWKVIPQLSLTDLINKIKPDKQGPIDGAKNEPPARSNKFSETEKKIVSELEKYLKDVDDVINKEFADITRECEALSVAEIEDDFEALENEVSRQYNAHVLEAQPDLVQLRTDERRELRNLKLFKEQNRLDRLAKYPSSLIFHIALIFLCLAAEAGVNMYYFSAGTDLGLLGGFLQALGVSVGNIAAAFTCGFLALRNMHHVKRFRAVSGTIGLGIWTGTTLVYHLLVAHYRDLLLTDPDHAMVRAWDAFRDAPFGFVAMDSYVVFIIGLIISIAALIDGYRTDDPYPGYGKIDRDYKDKLTTYKAAEKQVRSTMVTAMNEVEDKITKRLAVYEQRHRQLADRVTGAASVVEHFDNIYQQMEEILTAAVNMYREANLRVRTDPPPASFESMPIVKRLLRQDRFFDKMKEFSSVKDASSQRLAELRTRGQQIKRNFVEEAENLGKKADQFSKRVDSLADQEMNRDMELNIGGGV